MSETFNRYFEHMLLYIGKAATQEPECPMTSLILSEIIGWIFNDKERSSKILPKFQENRIKIHQKYASGSLDSPYSSYEEALKSRDRTLFKHIDLFPGNLSTQYNTQIEWFSSFLVSGMKEEHMKFVWIYLDKMNKYAGSINI